MEIEEEDLRELYQSRGVSPTEIAKQYNCSIDHINYLRRKYKIQKIERYERHKLQLTEKQKKIILGTVLGDGCLHQKDRYHRLLLEHGEVQKEYLEWKVEQLASLFKAKIRKQQRKHKFVETEVVTTSYAITSISHPELTELANLIYDKQGKKRITQKALDRIGWLGIAVFYMDDGSASENVNFHVCNYDESSIKALRDWLLVQGIRAYYTKKEKKNLLTVNDKDKIQFLAKISPYLISSMRYKGVSTRKDHSVWKEGDKCKCCGLAKGRKVGKLCASCYSLERRFPSGFVKNGVCYCRESPSLERLEELRLNKTKLVFHREFNPFVEEISFEDYTVSMIPLEKAAPLLYRYHYHRKSRKGTQLILGLWTRGHLVGAICYGLPARDTVLDRVKRETSQDFSKGSLFELTRFVLIDGLPKNTASYFFSRTLPLLKERNVEILISYSDTTYNHLGGIYRASNWLEFGITYPNYRYKEEDGTIVSRGKIARLAKQQKVTENQYAATNGYELVLEKFKNRFLYPVNKKLRKQLEKVREGVNKRR